MSSLPNQPSPPTDVVFDGDSLTIEDKKGPITTFGKLFAEWLMHEPEEVQFQQAYSVDGYEVSVWRERYTSLC